MIVVHWASFLAFAAHHPCQIDLLVLEHMSKHNSCHVSIISCLMIVREQSLTFVIAAVVFGVKSAAQVAFEFVITDALFVHLAKRCVVESLRVVCQYFGVIGVRESFIPLLRELYVRFRQRFDELVVKIEPVVHAVVANDWLFGFDHCLDHE